MKIPAFLKSLHKKTVFFRFAIREWWPLWFYVLNYDGRKKFHENKVFLSPLQERIVSELRTNGICFSSLDELFQDKNPIGAMDEFILRNVNNFSHYSKKDF